MTEKDLLNYWLTTAKEDFKTAEVLFKEKRYHHCLFFCHLALEKLLKGLVFKKTKTHALPIHDLLRLADYAKLTADSLLKKELEEITTWNIKTRYDNVKLQFYKKATADFTLIWFSRVKEIFLWLENQY